MKLINKKALIGAINEMQKESKGITFKQKTAWLFMILLGIYFSVNKNLYVSIPILILIIILFYSLFAALKFKYKNNINNEFYLQDGTNTINNNKIKIKVTLKNGIRDGLFIQYFRNSTQIEFKNNYSNGKLNGQCEEYYENGQLKIQSIWKDGIKNGKLYYYNNDGSLITESEIVNGHYKDVIEFDKYGKIKMKKNGNEYSFFNWYNFLSKNIKICEIIIGDGGEFLGIWTNYRPNGEIDFQLDFDNALKIEKNITDNYKKIDCYKVRKIIYNTFGEVESSYLIILKDKSHYQTNPSYCYYRFNELKYSYSTGIKGPPGFGGNIYIEITPVLGINDLIEIKDESYLIEGGF